MSAVMSVADQSTAPLSKLVLPSWQVHEDDMAMRPWVIELTHAGMPTLTIAAPSKPEHVRWLRVLSRATTVADNEGRVRLDERTCPHTWEQGAHGPERVVAHMELSGSAGRRVRHLRQRNLVQEARLEGLAFNVFKRVVDRDMADPAPAAGAVVAAHDGSADPRPVPADPPTI